jgi:nicotinamidase/pyrazinamidase
LTDQKPLLRPGDALLVVDVQRDFLSGGALAVPGGDAVIGPLNHALALCASRGAEVFVSRDWHPRDHCSFNSQGGPWPPHCIAGTEGAMFAEGLRLAPKAHVVSKGDEPGREAYSAFAGTDLEQQLREAGVRRLVVGGLATDYCVLQTVLDARRLGFDVVVLRDAIAAVDARDGAKALDAMAAAGGSLV